MNRAEIRGCHQLTKVIKVLINTRSSMPILKTKKREPQTVKSVFVLIAYRVKATVIPAVIPPAIIEDWAVNCAAT